MVDYARKMTVKKSCKYGEYGSFEHILFLFNLPFFLGTQGHMVVREKQNKKCA